jgi:photosystem II stability/assembly factor-like uncharacterized protein
MERVPPAGLRARTRGPVARSFVLLLAITAVLGAQQPPPAPQMSIRAPLAPKSLLLDVARAGNALVAVGERGHILTSTDGGASWKQSDVPTRSMLTAVHFHDSNLGWAVGHDAVILRTGNGGTTWERLHWAPEEETPFLDVLFLDARRGFAIGAYGLIYETEDGGTTWNEHRVSDEDFHLNQIATGPEGRLYIAAESGHVFRSDDEGQTWTALDTGYEGSFFGVLPLEGDSVLLFGLRGHLFRSDDAGSSWTQVETGTPSMLTSGTRLADGTIVIVGLGGTVLVSRDGGRSFELRQQSTRHGIQAVADAGNGRLVVSGENGVRTVAVTDLVQ